MQDTRLAVASPLRRCHLQQPVDIDPFEVDIGNCLGIKRQLDGNRWQIREEGVMEPCPRLNRFK